jgi:hypothetical protein
MTERSYEQELNIPTTRLFRFWYEVLSSVPSSEQELHHPEGRTASTNQGSDEWSDENIRKWLERDRLDPELDEWVRATLGE